jgi:hypothetical protein
VSRSRHKLDTTPLDYEESRQSEANKGMASFLATPEQTQAPVIEFRPVLAKPKQGAPEEGTPFSEPSALATTAGIPASGIPFSREKVNSEILSTNEADKPGTPEKGIPGQYYAPLSNIPARRKILPALEAQDGHTHGEESLYQALWKEARPYEKEIRIVTIGYRQMSTVARLTVNNCKANIQSLITKLAVEEFSSFSHSQARTYLIHSYKNILRRREAAGLTHVIRTRGVVFVDKQTGEAKTERVRDRAGIPFTGVPLSASDKEGTPAKGSPGTPPLSEAGVPLLAAYPYRQKIRQETDTTSDEWPLELGQEMRRLGYLLDHEALALLWQKCRSEVHDCTVGEVLHFVRARSGILRSQRTENTTGLILHAIPKCFIGQPFQDFRREQVKAIEPEQGSADLRQQYEHMLTDPDLSQRDREVIEELLRDLQ